MDFKGAGLGGMVAGVVGLVKLIDEVQTVLTRADKITRDIS